MLLNAPCSSPFDAVKLTDHLGHMFLLVNDTPVRIVRRFVLCTDWIIYAYNTTMKFSQLFPA